MGIETKIEWADHTANFWEGCTQISPACALCYAMKRAERYGSVEWNGPPRKVKAGLQTLRAVNRIGQAERRVQTVFINSLSDSFDKQADPAWRREMFDAIKAAPWVLALILTKRIGNVIEMSEAAGGFPKNAALGATMVNQEEIIRDAVKFADAVIGCCPARAFLSIEPMLGPIELPASILGTADAIICGGESGNDEEGEEGAKVRPMHPDWPRKLRDQCARHGIAFHFKQWGEYLPNYQTGNKVIGNDPRFRLAYALDGTPRVALMERVGKIKAGRLLDGCTHDAFLPIDRSKPFA